MWGCINNETMTWYWFIAEDNSNADWTVRHGRSAALFSVLKSAPSKILEVATPDQISSTLLSYLSSDRLALVENALSGVAFFITHQLATGEPVPPGVVQTFGKVTKTTLCLPEIYIIHAWG